jgi:hypothetical protein
MRMIRTATHNNIMKNNINLAKLIMRFIRYAFLVISCIVSTDQIFGMEDITMVDATNIQTMPFIVKTDFSILYKTVGFTAIAAPHASSQLSLGGATLTVYDGTNLVSSSVIAPDNGFVDIVGTNMALAIGGGLFSFDAGASHLADVNFEIDYAVDRETDVMCYRFRLQTFASAKIGVGLSLGVTNDCINVTRVLPNSPAAKAGLSPGLVLQRINGVAASVILGIERRLGIDPVYLGDAIGEYLSGPRDTKLQLELMDTAKGTTNIFELKRL